LNAKEMFSMQAGKNNRQIYKKFKSREYHKNHRISRRMSLRKSCFKIKYGMILEDYEKLLKSQDGK